MRKSTLLLSVPFVTLLSACGGGGEEVVTDAPIINTLTNLSDATELLKLSQGSTGVSLADATIASTKDNWDSAKTLDYVAVLDNDASSLVGLAFDEIPNDVSFSSNAGSINATVGVDDYVLTDGAVDATINSSGTLDLTVSGGAQKRTQGLESISEASLSVNILTSQSGTPCGGANLFCGGDMTVIADGGTHTTTLEDNDFTSGIFGQSAPDVELGGVINYENETPGDGINAVVGSFIAD